MGLAGRKQKQRIPADPRNLSWADDASRFGQSYLSKFGWDASQGLGSSGEGMKTHLKVQQKLDMIGIGAQHQRDPNGTAWKQNKEFEALLKRLNEGAKGEVAKEDGGEDGGTALGKTFVRAQENVAEGKSGNDSSVTTKKRNHKDRDGPDTNKNAEKHKKREKRKKCGSEDSGSDRALEPLPTVSLGEPHARPVPKPRPMVHRARARAAACIAGKPASAISEILGIPPSSSVSTLASTPTLVPSSASSPVPRASLSLDNLTASTKSIADYFKEKLAGRSTSSSPASAPSTPSGSATPGFGATEPKLGLSDISPPDGEFFRGGIGSKSLAASDNHQDALTEKQRRKAERNLRKAEKRKYREAEAGQSTPKRVSTEAKEQTEGEDMKMIQRSKKHKRDKEPKE